MYNSERYASDYAVCQGMQRAFEDLLIEYKVRAQAPPYASAPCTSTHTHIRTLLPTGIVHRRTGIDQRGTPAQTEAQTLRRKQVAHIHTRIVMYAWTYAWLLRSSIGATPVTICLCGPLPCRYARADW
jgi:hypothetical protein